MSVMTQQPNATKAMTNTAFSQAVKAKEGSCSVLPQAKQFQSTLRAIALQTHHLPPHHSNS
jgi:hypothetical protein